MDHVEALGCDAVLKVLIFKTQNPQYDLLNGTEHKAESKVKHGSVCS